MDLLLGQRINRHRNRRAPLNIQHQHRDRGPLAGGEIGRVADTGADDFFARVLTGAIQQDVLIESACVVDDVNVDVQRAIAQPGILRCDREDFDWLLGRGRCRNRPGGGSGRSLRRAWQGRECRNRRCVIEFRSPPIGGKHQDTENNQRAYNDVSGPIRPRRFLTIHSALP